jgi:hypothetical protein
VQAVSEFLVKLLLSAAVALLIKGGFALFHSSVAWWIASIAGLAIVFLGEWVLSSDGGWS